MKNFYRKIKFLLINTASEYWRVVDNDVPKFRTILFRFSMSSSLSVAAFAADYVETQILDEDIEKINSDADIIGITHMTYKVPRAYKIADYFRKVKGKTVILGGYHSTFMPEESIQFCDSICVEEAKNNLSHILMIFVMVRIKFLFKRKL